MVNRNWVPVKKRIPDHYTDEDILRFVSEITGLPVGRVVVQVFEPNGDVRMSFESKWRYVQAVSEAGIHQMLLEQ